MKISVIGAGSFGTAMALVAARCGNHVMLWAHDPRVAEEMRATGSNSVYLPDIPLGDSVTATSDLGEAAAFSDTIFMVVPSHHYRSVLTQLLPHLRNRVSVISGTKGIENQTLERMSEVSKAVLGDAMQSFAVLSGPTFAVEAARGDPTAAVIASSDVEFAKTVQQALSGSTFRLYHSDDVVGVELGGSLKNVVAIAAGVLEGLGLGSNTNAALITRGLREITRLGMALGGRIETFAGLAGMGDLVATCTSVHSRNRFVGEQLGKGLSLDEIIKKMHMVAEGVKSVPAVIELADANGVAMPIAREVYRVVHEGGTPRQAFRGLIRIQSGDESEPG